MCYFTYAFYSCRHRARDHIIKCEKKKNDGTGTHCDPDQRGFKHMPECGIQVEDIDRLCGPCQELERNRRQDEAEAEAIRRDLEQARKMDLEEQRRKAEAHEAHMNSIQEQSLAKWERQNEAHLQRVLKESMQRQMEEAASQMEAAMKASRMEYSAYMEMEYGEFVEEGSSRDQAIKRKSTMDWHHPKWTSSVSGSQGGMAELEAKMSSSLSMSESHRSESHHAAEKRQWASSSNAENASTASIPSPPPPPPLPPASTSSGFSAKSRRDSKASLRASRTVESASASATSAPPPPPLPPVQTSKHSASGSASTHATSDHAVLLKKAVHTRASRRSTTGSVPRELAPPAPAFPPVDYSQPPRDQNYGRFMIGTRHQPIHPSQDVVEAPATPPKPVLPRAPAPAVRLRGSVTPAEVRAPTGFQVGPGGLQNRLRPSGSVRRPAPRPPVATAQPPNELEAIWNRRGIQRGIQRDVDDDNISTVSVTPSQSASQVSSRRFSEDSDDEK
ncbi:hypothetical protein K458DRAFT_167523 [Lentithecium fluviatile CBS 122367]|uniref:Uncharacterized protein n=1 Tax=Lentithecium fluviatile CBS 122367 TaxID=1168545 RepID=A0A6G1JAS7_9PLEO|nr:hypothetical protein K458DRAFT_167523 [Lentithecium fluviatile CBS 122367]